MKRKISPYQMTLMLDLYKGINNYPLTSEQRAKDIEHLQSIDIVDSTGTTLIGYGVEFVTETFSL